MTTMTTMTTHRMGEFIRVRCGRFSAVYHEGTPIDKVKQDIQKTLSIPDKKSNVIDFPRGPFSGKQ